MQPTIPNRKTTLVLSAAFIPLGFFNARSTIRNMIVGGVRAYSADGNIYDWKQWTALEEYADDQPSLRSARSEFPVPTVVVIPGYVGKFSGNRKKAKRVSSLRQIFNLYEGTCAYCLKPVPFSLATKDHSVPKAKGGHNYDSNIVLACKKCNNKKGSKFPFFDIRGNEVKPKVLGDLEFAVKADNLVVRPEWEMFLGKKEMVTA